MATINVQSTHSRNGHDWSYERNSSGRLCLVANGKGVKYRIGMVFAHLAREGGRLSAGKLLAYLQRLHKSYTSNDLSQVRSQLVKVGAIETRGRGSDAVWAITGHGRAIMGRVDYNWV